MDKQCPDGYKTASMCGGPWFGKCVAVKIDADVVHVMDTKTGNVLTYDRDEWAVFVNGVKRGEFDI